MFEKEAEEYFDKNKFYSKETGTICLRNPLDAFKDGANFGYNKANEWFDAKENIPLPKKAEIYRYTLEVISDKGDIVCYDFKDKCWKKLVIEDEKVTYIPVEIKMWCNKPIKEGE